MRDKEINIAIAEALGWKTIGSGQAGSWQSPSGNICWMYPNYCEDLRLMHEAEKSANLDEQEQDQYIFELANVCGCNLEHDLDDLCQADYYVFATATALQRAEALLKTLEKRKEHD